MLTWIIDKHVDRVRGAQTPFIDEALKRGHIVHALRDSIIPKEVDLTGITATGPTLVRGSHGFVNYVERELNPNPGGFTHHENFKLSVYAKAIGEYCLNHEYHIITYDQFIHDREQYGSVFVKPHGDLKRFTGVVVPLGDMLDAAHYRKFGKWIPLDHQTEIIVAPVIEVKDEFRIVVVNGKPITGSTYDVNNPLPVPDNMMATAAEVAAIWNPAVVYVVDIGRTPAGNKVVEYNQFSTSAMYNCDQGAIVDALVHFFAN